MDKKENLDFNFGFAGRITRLLDLSGLSITSDPEGKKNLRIDIDRETKKVNVSRNRSALGVTSDKYISPAQKILETYSRSTLVTQESWGSWLDLLNDLEELYYNAPVIAKAIIIMRDETTQADTNFKVIGVEAEDPLQRQFIETFLAKINIEKYIRDIAFNIILYGNAGLVPTIGLDGIKKVNAVKPKKIQEIYEFTAADFMENNQAIGQLGKAIDKIGELISAIEENADHSDLFETFNLGYKVNNVILPPWGFIHFRNYSTASPFEPFGMPFFIHSLAPYRELEIAKSLITAAQAARFPIYQFELNLPNQMAPTDQLSTVTEFMNELDNSGLYSVRKETAGVGERVVTIKDLFEFKILEQQIDLGSNENLEGLMDALMNSTFLPKSVIDPNVSGLGASGVSLVQQFKPFARTVYAVQTCILEGLTQLVKIEMILSNKFAKDDINFTLTMPYPESQTDRELIGAQTDLLALANSVIDTLAQRLLGDPQAELPFETIRGVLRDILPYDASKIDLWTQQIVDSRKPEEEEAKEESARKIRLIPKKRLAETVHSVKKEVILNQIHEGPIAGKHYYRSSKLGSSESFDVNFLYELKKTNVNKLKESKRGKINVRSSKTNR